LQNTLCDAYFSRMIDRRISAAAARRTRRGEAPESASAGIRASPTAALRADPGDPSYSHAPGHLTFGELRQQGIGTAAADPAPTVRSPVCEDGAGPEADQRLVRSRQGETIDERGCHEKAIGRVLPLAPVSEHPEMGLNHPSLGSCLPACAAPVGQVRETVAPQTLLCHGPLKASIAF
jgi:hypothetical protein